MDWSLVSDGSGLWGLGYSTAQTWRLWHHGATGWGTAPANVSGPAEFSALAVNLARVPRSTLVWAAGGLGSYLDRAERRLRIGRGAVQAADRRVRPRRAAHADLPSRAVARGRGAAEPLAGVVLGRGAEEGAGVAGALFRVPVACVSRS